MLNQSEVNMACNSLHVIFVVILIGYTSAQFTKTVGDSCRTSTNSPGRCVYFEDCDQVVSDNPGPDDVCAWESGEVIVCCPRSDDQTRFGNEFKTQSQSAPASISAQQKCREYSKYRPLRTVSTIYGGVDVTEISQFPHMALLGYDINDDVKWLCGGTIISENFILTAAHCLNSGNFPVTRVQVGFLDKRNRDAYGILQEFRVANMFVHPERNPPVVYHDIALLKLDRPIRLSNLTYPACLYNEHSIKVPRATATGWGLKELTDSEGANILQKVILPIIPREECEELYPPQKTRLPRGIIDATQFCAGENGKDACKGDSGGPIQIHDTTGMINIVGITSFGSSCGSSPGVYTRVSNYVPWIEKIVWG